MKEYILIGYNMVWYEIFPKGIRYDKKGKALMGSDLI